MRTPLLVALLLLPGCLGGGGSAEPPATPPAPATPTPPRPLEGVTLVSDPPEGPAPWTTLDFEASGEPGTWVVGYRSLPRGFRGGLDVESRVTATGDPTRPVRLWVFAPQVVGNESGLDVASYAHQGFVVEPVGGRAVWSDATTVGLGRSRPAGVFFAVASDAAWEATFRLTLLDDVESGEEFGNGRTIGPEILAGRRGAVLAHAFATTPFAGTTRLEQEWTTPGWTHLSVLWKRPPMCPRNGERAWDVTFPNETANVRHGMSAFGRYDYAGTFQDRPGTLRAAVEYQEQTTGVDLGLVHLPTEPLDFPAELRSGPYRRSQDSDPCEG